MFGSSYSAPRFLTWILKRDWIVTLLVRREKFVTTFRPDLLSEHCFGSVGQTFLQNLTWSFGCSDVSGVIKI
jgi:hypothetical protein